MESSLNNGRRLPRTLRPSEYFRRHSKFMAKPESITDVADLYGDHHGDLYPAECAEVHQYRFEVRT